MTREHMFCIGQRVVIRESSGIVRELHLAAGIVKDRKSTIAAGRLAQVVLDEPIELAVSKIKTIWIRERDLMW